MYLSRQRYEEIKEIVFFLYRDYGVNTVPIDFEDLADKMGIRLVPYSSLKKDQKKKFLTLSKDGFSNLNKKEKCYYIYYNDDVAWQRVRFTIMHEIGHIVLGHSEYSEKNEAEANFFSRSALAPVCLLMKWEISELEDVVSTFDISYEAAKYICGNLEKRKLSNNKDFADYELKMINLFE